MRRAATAIALVIIALGLTGCNDTGSLAKQHMAENNAAIEAEIRKRLTKMTNFNAGEVDEIWKSLRANVKGPDCRRPSNNWELVHQRHEAAEVCTLRMKAREPLMLDVEADYLIHMALEGNSYSANPFHKYPIIGSWMKEVRIYDFRQGILSGETRKPGAWRLKDPGKADAR